MVLRGGESLLELEELLLLALADGVVLVRLLALVEGIAARARALSVPTISCNSSGPAWWSGEGWGRDVRLARWADAARVAGTHGAGGGREGACCWARGLEDGLAEHDVCCVCAMGGGLAGLYVGMGWMGWMGWRAGFRPMAVIPSLSSLLGNGTGKLGSTIT